MTPVTTNLSLLVSHSAINCQRKNRLAWCMRAVSDGIQQFVFFPLQGLYHMFSPSPASNVMKLCTCELLSTTWLSLPLFFKYINSDKASYIKKQNQFPPVCLCALMSSPKNRSFAFEHSKWTEARISHTVCLCFDRLDLLRSSSMWNKRRCDRY